MNESIFLTGRPRSGTTWVAKMLYFSPSVNYISGEPFLNPGFSKEMYGYDWLWYYAISGQEGEALEQILKNTFNQPRTFEDFDAVTEIWKQHLETDVVDRIVKETEKETEKKTTTGFLCKKLKWLIK